MKNNTITIRLDTVRKYRNASEYRLIGRARSGGLEVVGDGRLIRKILQQRHAAGASLEATVEVFRGETLCFVRAPLKSWVISGKNAISKRSTVRCGNKVPPM